MRGKILRELGVRFGRYHVFSPFRLIKPEAVSLRTSTLEKFYHQKYLDLKPANFWLKFFR